MHFEIQPNHNVVTTLLDVLTGNDIYLKLASMYISRQIIFQITLMFNLNHLELSLQMKTKCNSTKFSYRARWREPGLNERSCTEYPSLCVMGMFSFHCVPCCCNLEWKLTNIKELRLLFRLFRKKYMKYIELICRNKINS